MKRTFPILPTLVVLIAVGIMVGLGMWQLGRRAEKEALLSLYQSARVSGAEVPWPGSAEFVDQALYRRSRLLCAKVTGHESIAGRNAAGEAGIAQYAQCSLPDGSSARVVMGWSRDPSGIGDWAGGEVRGVIAPGPRLVADPPLGGLIANSLPDPSDIPNNHLAYAVQWFIFALTALAIYGVALWRRLQA